MEAGLNAMLIEILQRINKLDTKVDQLIQLVGEGRKQLDEQDEINRACSCPDGGIEKVIEIRNSIEHTVFMHQEGCKMFEVGSNQNATISFTDEERESIFKCPNHNGSNGDFLSTEPSEK